MKHDMNATETIEQKGADVTDALNIEQHSKTGGAAPTAKKYRIRIDKDHFDIANPVITGRELLMLASKEPVERFAVYQKVKGGGTERIALGQSVDVRTAGLERFVTLPLDQTEGSR